MPVTPHLAIIVDLDRVPAVHSDWIGKHNGKDNTAFALTISAGLVKVYETLDTSVNPPVLGPPPLVLPPATRWAEVSKWFLPWNWFPKHAADSRRSPPFVRVWRKLKAGGDYTLLSDDAGNTLWPVRDLYDGAVSPLQAEGDLKADSANAHNFLDACWKLRTRDDNDTKDWKLEEEERITWRTPVEPPADPDLHDETNQFRLTTQIAKTGTSCFPQNHASGLACCVIVTLDPTTIQDGDSFMALPVWPDAWGAPEDALAAPGDASGDATIEKRGLYSLPDAGWARPIDAAGTPLPIFGYSRVWTYRPPNPADVQFLDLGKMLVKLQKAWHDDWLARLEGETAALFDLSQRLVDAARDYLDGYQPELTRVADLAALPPSGRKRVIVALVGAEVHLRIFDFGGVQTDKPESQLQPGVDLEKLRALLVPVTNPLPDTGAMTREKRQEIVDRALKLAGIHFQTVKAKPVAQWIVLASRELAGFGTRVASDRSVLTLSPREKADLLTLGQLADIKNYDETFATSAENWLAEIDEMATGSERINFRPGSLNVPELNPDKLPPFTGRSFRDFAKMLDADEPLTHEHVSLWERFVSDMRDADTIRDLVLHQWCWVAKNKSTPFLSLVRRRLNESINPFRQMVRGLLVEGKYWAAILKTGSAATGSVVQANILAQFEQCRLDFAQRFAMLKPLPALDADLLNCLAHVVKSEAARIAPDITSPAQARPRPRERPQSVTLEFDVPGHADDADDTADQQQDFLSRIAGVVVLARNPADTVAGAKWRCLNYVQLKLVPDGVTKPGDIAAIAPLDCLYLAPNRPGYTSAKRETTLTYDNHPLVAESPAAALFVQSAAGFPAGFDERETDKGRVLHVSVAKGSALLSEAQIIGLAYGRTLAFAAFPVLNTGILHPRLSAGHPALPRAITSVDIATTFGCEIDVPYRRLVGVNEPRMLKNKFYGGTPALKTAPGVKENDPFVPPEIPRSVRPLAWEITGENKQGFGDDSELLRRPSLILLSKIYNSVTIHLRKPTTGLENWSRWHAADSGMNARRAKEYELDAEQAEAWLNPTPPPQKDISLDDPALENFLLVEAECLFSLQQPLPVVTAATTIPWPVGSGPNQDTERRESNSFVFRINATAGLTSAELAMPEGSVWRVRFHPLVSEDDFKKFEPAAFRTAEEAAKKGEPGDWQISDPDRVIGGKHYVVFRPTEMLVEAATAKMPQPDDIWSRLEASTSGDAVELALVGDGTHYFVEVDPTTKEKKERGDALFAFVSRVEVRHQVWNWTGWQTNRFPFTQQLPFDDESGEAFQWDATGFHDRSPWQYANSEITIAWRNERKTRRLATLFTQSHAGDPRALYHRFSAVLRSRYEGLDGVFYSKPVAASREIADGNVTVPDPWRRCLLRPRPLERLPRPSVNIIVPLTRKYDPGNFAHPQLAENKTAGLLIVLRDRWYSQAGLAEMMEMEIGVHQHWTKPNGGNWSSLDYWAAGYDPIVSTEALADGKTALRQVFDPGPVGHTFDIGASSPLLAASSFVLDALPAAIQTTVPDLSWFMAQIRLRRVHAPGALAGSDGTGTVDETWASEWTAPEWVQFLPDANHLLPQKWRERGTVLMRKKTGADQIDAAEWEEPDRGVNADNHLFDHWLLITRPVVDVRGQQQEQYVGILGQKDPGDMRTLFSIIDGELPSAPQTQGAPFFIRVMELRLARRNLAAAVVQEKFRENLRSLPAGATHKFDLLFGYKDGKARVLEDAWAQITALSDRLDVQFTNPTE